MKPYDILKEQGENSLLLNFSLYAVEVVVTTTRLYVLWTKRFWLQSQMMGGAQVIHLGFSPFLFPGNVNSCLVDLTGACEKCFIIFGEKVIFITVNFFYFCT